MADENEAREVMERLRKDYCYCDAAYTTRGLTDPNCQSCDSEDERRELAALIARLLSDLEAARKRAEAAEQDAGRYRWLRVAVGEDYFAVCEPDGYNGDCLKHAEALDAAIDAARQDSP